MTSPANPRPRWRRIAGALTVVAVVLLGWSSTAAADPAVPTDFRSEILAVDPSLPDGVTIRVIGGDSFLELSVARGHRVTVPDYDSEVPYLEFLADGTVRRNDSSAAAAINESRYGAGTWSGETTPDWVVVARDGRYAWHDHRIHWMSRSAPPLVAGTRKVAIGDAAVGGDWIVGLTVDGNPVEVRGRLLLLRSPSPVPWFSLVVVVFAALAVPVVLRIRRGHGVPYRVVAAALAAVGVLATVAGAAQWRAIPADAGGSPSSAVVPAVAVLAALAAFAFAAPRVRLIGLVAAIAALAGWGWLRRTVLLRAVLPTTLPAVDRVATAAALGIALAAAVIVLWRPPVASARDPRSSPSS